MQNGRIEDLMVDVQRIWQQYLDVLQTVSSASESAETPLTDMLDTWWQSARSESTESVRPLFEPLVNHAQVLFRLTDRLVQEIGNAGNQPVDLNQLLKEHLTILSESLSNSQVFNSGITTPISHLVSQWHQSAGDIIGLSEQQLTSWYESFHKPGSNHLENLDSLFQLPHGILSHLHQAATEQFLSALIAYQSNFNDYIVFAARVTTDSVKEMQKWLANAELDPDNPRFSMDYYTQWLNCCEAVYKEHVHTDEYVTLHTRLINSAVQVRLTRQRVVDEAASWLGLPTRAEQDLLIEQITALKRELSSIRHQSKQDEATITEKPVQRAEPVPKKKGVRKKVSTRKKTVSKKVSRKTVAKKSVKKKTAKIKSTKTTDNTTEAV